MLKNVLTQIKQSTVYLGLFTKELEIDDVKGRRWSPGVWIMEEKGMALGLEKPFVLVIHKDIHDDFWKKTSPQRVHIFFDDSTFQNELGAICDAVADRYEEVALRSLQI